jgi:uncharacterized protein (TIGR00730 family)
LNTIITVFGSGKTAAGSENYRTAQALGMALARAGFAVATGGYGGTMGAVSLGAKEAGGKVIGVTCDEFASPANGWVTEEIRVKTWSERLFKLVELGAGYVVLPGGSGTLVELAVVWERMSKGFLPQRPCILLGEYWLPVVRTIPAGELSGQPFQSAPTVEDAVVLLQSKLRS